MTSPLSPGDAVSSAKRQKTESAAAADDIWESIHAQKWQGLGRKTGRFEVRDVDSFKNCHPATVLAEASALMNADDVLCVDTGDVTLCASLCASLTKGQRTLSSERLGTMGYSLCAAFAAC